MRGSIPAQVRLGKWTVKVLWVGDSWPDPKRGYPPFIVEREPLVSLQLEGIIKHLVPFSNINGLPLDFKQQKRLAAWLVKQTPRAIPAQEIKPVQERRTVKPGARKTVSHWEPKCVTEEADVDYWAELSLEDKAWLNQFLGEVYANAWPKGVDHFYAKGSPERRALQFSYNHRYKDIFNRAELQRTELSKGDDDE